MLAAERGAAVNTLSAYRRDLEGAEAIVGDLAAADRAALGSLAAAWAPLAPASVARKASALRQFYGFLVDEGEREDDPSPALPRPAGDRDHALLPALPRDREERRVARDRRDRQRHQLGRPQARAVE